MFWGCVISSLTFSFVHYNILSFPVLFVFSCNALLACRHSSSAANNWLVLIADSASWGLVRSRLWVVVCNLFWCRSRPLILLILAHNRCILANVLLCWAYYVAGTLIWWFGFFVAHSSRITLLYLSTLRSGQIVLILRKLTLWLLFSSNELVVAWGVASAV